MEGLQPYITVLDVARVTHEANRAYCLTLGDNSQVPWDEAPEWQRESACAGVQAVIDGSASNAREQHTHWMQQKIADGWKYGEQKDIDAKTHPCLVNFAALPIEQQKKDWLFRAVIQALMVDSETPV